MLKELKEQVCWANHLLPEYELVTLTWGNVSGIDRERGLMVIKPSGVDYPQLTPDNMVVLDLDGNIVEGELNPSSDASTHLVLYRSFSEIGGVVHTHSTYATAWSQANRPIPAFGTTHGDYMYGEIPCTRAMYREEIQDDYERRTGDVIVETLQKLGKNSEQAPAVLVANHGPFVWGADPVQAVEYALILEEVAKMASLTLQINPDAKPMPQELMDKHYFRKHGTNAYYGQSHGRRTRL
ncbi:MULTISPECIES: L-ribulose-5-phosphate 4-epimerase [Eubacteriales]|uniref:L-ribulose-5-phosphate 4-epimerase n=1 Tax=Eubacteriales TaxID=186802 RepID=UPI00026F20E1|nr:MULTISPECIES: L-ribulose-5-phosphate 4-epimerase [Eubacteriales]EJF40820.1 putative L-ribulose-5-phosphate 4-epimerase [Clostridium sp. MSTE9]